MSHLNTQSLERAAGLIVGFQGSSYVSSGKPPKRSSQDQRRQEVVKLTQEGACPKCEPNHPDKAPPDPDAGEQRPPQ
jgi:hypothetical protein